MQRRDALKTMGTGFGMLALADLLTIETEGADNERKGPHFPPKAKHVIFLFMNGAMSQVDTFDPKPMLDKLDGQPLPGPPIKTDRASGNLMRSPFAFKKHGQSGIEVSEIFPKVAEMIDDFCVVRSMHTDIGNHGPSLYMMNCGHNLAGRPSMGSWITYGLGTENRNLPGFVVLCPGLPVVGAELWGSAFLPSTYQGAHIRNNEKEPDKLINYIRNKELTPPQQTEQLALTNRLNRLHLEQTGPSPQLESVIESMEVAYRMQTEASDVFDIAKESAATRARYGDGEFGRGCLMALRLVERGVRMTQVYTGSGQPWDTHDDIREQARIAKQVDAPIAALIRDLKDRGLFNETLVVVTGEFGRAPMIQSSGLEKIGYGRDHNVHGFTALLAGGGVKGGIVHGATDEFGLKAVENKVHVHDLQATILHLLGLDHTKLTYRHSSRDFRLTDVQGEVVKSILA